MRKLARLMPVSLAVLLLAACSPATPGDTPPLNNPGDAAADQVTLAAGLAELQPAAIDTLSGSVDLSRFGASAFDRVYELETGAGSDFSFNVVARGEGNFGLTRLSVGHVRSNGLALSGGIESLVAAGMTVDAPGLDNRGDMVDVNGDGFARVTIRGNISGEQVLIVQVPRLSDVLNIGIRIGIGADSEINLRDGQTEGARPGATWQDVYSSDSVQFGLPAIAVSGDRYSLAAYDGDPNSPSYSTRNRVWMQVDAQTGNITGGMQDSMSADSLFWRDQEIAALGNVLAVAYIGGGTIQAEVSLDRGASFPIVQAVDPLPAWGLRLVQIAIAQDYRLGVLYWRNEFQGNNPRSELVLVEATPTGFDANNTPVAYNWGAPKVVHNVGRDATPLLMQLEYSSAGDLVIGYGYATMDPVPNMPQMVSRASFRVAVRLAGQVNFQDRELDNEENLMPTDPHISVLGAGPSMEIFYSYEKSDGVYVLYSSNAGQSFTQATHVAVPGAFMPSVHARMQGADKRVDVLYCSPANWGIEIHNLQWDIFAPGVLPRVYRLTEVTAVPGGNPPPGMPLGNLITTVAWFGYDAVIAGDDVVVAVHELTYDSYEFYWAFGWPGMPMAGTGGGMVGPTFTGGAPVLLPGMTGSLPAPNAAHRNQLRLCILD